MDRPIRIAVNPVTRTLRSQIETLTARPSLGEGLPIALADLEARLAKITEAESAQESIKRTLVATTDELHRLAFEAREAARLNVANAAYRLGRHSADVAALGGKSRSGRTKKSAASETGSEAPSAPAAATAPTADAATPA